MSVCVVANVPCKPVVVSVSCLSNHSCSTKLLNCRFLNVLRMSMGTGGEVRGGKGMNKKTSNKQTTKSVPILCLSMLKIFCTGLQFEVYHSCCSEIYLMVLMQC